MSSFKRAKKRIKKESESKELLQQAEKFKDLIENSSEKLLEMYAIMALSGVCEHYETSFKIPGITSESLEKGNTKIPKLSEKQTLWCSFELEDIIQRSFRTLTRIVDEFGYNELHKGPLGDFKNKFVTTNFAKLYFKELENLKVKYKNQLKTRYKDTKNALNELFKIQAYYKLFKKFVSKKLEKISKKNRMYIKTLITKTDKNFTEMEKVIKEGEEINHEEEALSLLEFEEAGIEIKWVGYSRKEALKVRKKYERISG